MLDGVRERKIVDRFEWLAWRQGNVNASEAACLWGDGVHQYTTAYKMWAIRSGLYKDDEDSPAKRRGRLFEDDAIEMIADEHPGWSIWQPGVYLDHPEWRIGCTPDAYVNRPDQPQANLQIKTVGKWAFKKHWVDPDTGEESPPLWIAVQSAIETIMSGLDHGMVGAMIIGDGDIDIRVFDVPIRQGLLTNLRPLVDDFWRRVANNEPYPLDEFRDVDLALSLRAPDMDGEPQIDLTGDDAFRLGLDARAELKAREADGNAAEKERKALDKNLILRMGNARVAMCGSRIMTVKTIERDGYTVKPTSFQTVSVK